MSYLVIGVWCLFVGLWLWNPITPRYVYYYLPLSIQQSRWVYAVLLLHEICWPAWLVVITTAFYCYWCADVFTLNDVFAKMM